MKKNQYLGVVVIIAGIISIILTLIQVKHIKKSCDDNKDINNINYVVFGLSILLIIVGMILLSDFGIPIDPLLKFSFG